MTEFEEQVAAALCPARPTAGNLAGAANYLSAWRPREETPETVLRALLPLLFEAIELAPRVAAAIDAASLVPLARMSNTSGVARTVLDEDARSAGLAALRGEP